MKKATLKQRVARVKAQAGMNISEAVRRVVVKRNGELTISELDQLLIKGGRSAREVKERRSAIATLFSDCRSTIAVAKTLGMWKQ
jgi:hypothetical protein